MDPAVGAVGTGGKIPGGNHQRHDHREVQEHAEQHAPRRAHPHQAAGAEHRDVEGKERQAELWEGHFRERRHRHLPQLLERVIPLVEGMGEVEGRPESEEPLLEEPHEVLPFECLEGAGEEAGGDQGPGLGHPGVAAAAVEGVEDDATGLPLGEGELFVVDEPALHREGDEDPQQRENDIEGRHLPPGDDRVLDPHVGGHPGDQRASHVAGGGGDALGGIVFEDREITDADLREDPKRGIGENHACQADAERPAGLRADVEIRGGEDATEKEAGGTGPERELRHVAAVDLRQPPAVLLLGRPVAGLRRGELLNGH